MIAAFAIVSSSGASRIVQEVVLTHQRVLRVHLQAERLHLDGDLTDPIGLFPQGLPAARPRVESIAYIGIAFEANSSVGPEAAMMRPGSGDPCDRVDQDARCTRVR